ncbi:MAG: 5-formyltetrahydrofolate cyclo-ligase [Oscillospiraceae bacterium]|nr:5-formyltetrahydrofolate cyclo-ligase [Oscillospiraceae bacterium]
MKQEYRARFLQQRNQLSSQFITESSAKICERVIKLPQFSECDAIFTYQSFGSEVDTQLLIEQAWDAGKKVCIPKIAGKRKMDFYCIEKGQPLKANKYGILEPTDDCELAFPNKKSMFVIPGLAFDKNGYRIGYGAGFYDIYLAEREVLAKIGICFDLQIVDDAYPDSHDIPVSVIVTEKNVY